MRNALLILLFFFAIACTEQSRTLADHDTVAANDNDVVKDEKDISDIKDEMVDEDIIATDDLSDDITSDEGGDELLSDSDTPVVCADVALNACNDTPGCELSELPIISHYGSCYTEVVPVACMATADKVCPSPQWADPEYVYDPATGRCFLFYEGCFPDSWQYTVGTYPTECAGGVAPITLPPCNDTCHGLLPAQCSQTPDCIPLRSQRLRWGETYDNRANCIEEREWVGCFANSELACRDSAFYPVIDLNGQCWMSDGCEPLWWQYPAPGSRCDNYGVPLWPDMGSCGSRFCDDGSEINCQMGMPACDPPTSIPALQKGCWVCVEPISCLPPEAEDHCASSNECYTNDACPLGYACTTMLSCYNAEWPACAPHECWTQSIEALECNGLKPDCGNGVAIINAGCWVCVDATGCLPQ